MDLMRALPGRDIEVVSCDDAIPAHDVHIPLMSLPRALGVHTESQLSAPQPYLRADPARVAEWSAKLPPHGGGLRIGVCWAGNPRYTRDRERSIDPRLLEPLVGVEGATWFCLQKQPWPGAAPVMFEPPQELRDLSGIAALMMHLDLILTVETSIAQLAGALGRPVWVMLSDAADWRWKVDRTDTPWYPTMRLFRQPAPGDWAAVVRDVVAALRQLNRLKP
jgi:hypothetical protein